MINYQHLPTIHMDSETSNQGIHIFNVARVLPLSVRPRALAARCNETIDGHELLRPRPKMCPREIARLAGILLVVFLGEVLEQGINCGAKTAAIKTVVSYNYKLF